MRSRLTWPDVALVVLVYTNQHPRPGTDPIFLRGGGANSQGRRQHTILPNFPQNCMKLKECGPQAGGGVGEAHIQNFTM